MTGSSVTEPAPANRLLLLLRHGEAETRAASGLDHERTLTRRGMLEAARTGRRCLERGWLPQRVLASPALRARATAEAVARELGLPAHAIELREPLYLADVEALLGEIAAVDASLEVLMMVGHNPGLSDLAAALAPDHALPVLGTGTVCALEFAAPSWSELAIAHVLEARCEAPQP